MLTRLLSGPRILRAPEDDRGSASDDLDEDFSLDPPDDEDDQQDDLQDDDQDDLDDEDLTGLEDDDEGDDPPARQPSRGENRVAKATRAAKEATERADRLERRLEEIASQVRPAQTQETPQQREARLAAMDPYERLQVELQETRQETRLFQQRLEFETRDNSDKVAYDALCQRAPVAAKFKDEVEQRLADMRKAGTTAPRETVLRWVIGDRALKNAGKATSRARKSADQNRERHQARAPAGGRGDAPQEGRNKNGASARDKRLENMNL